LLQNISVEIFRRFGAFTLCFSGDRGVSQTEARRSRSILGSSGERTRKKVSEFHAIVQELRTNAIAQSATVPQFATSSITKRTNQPPENAREAVSKKAPVRSIVQGCPKRSIDST